MLIDGFRWPNVPATPAYSLFFGDCYTGKVTGEGSLIGLVLLNVTDGGWCKRLLHR
jgi:hypothetical protein